MSSSVQPTVLADRYELGDVLGRGGMAEVYLAHDRRLGRTVAVKVMRADLVDKADFVARFGKEARSVAALNHPTVVAVYDSGEARLPPGAGAVDPQRYDTVPYIVMEYVQGRTLAELIDQGPVPVDQALRITVGVLTALEQAHAAGIVHRDIKPSNVMLTSDGAVKVMDFGIARVLSDATMTTNVIATPHYVSPEHAHGERVDARSDLYSVGCLLFELLTGRPPFVAETSLAVVVAHLNEPPPRPSVVHPGLPPVLDQVVAKALAKGRDDRYQTAAQFRDDLEAAARGEVPTVAASGLTGPPVAPPLPARGPVLPPSPPVPASVVPAFAAPTVPGPGAGQVGPPAYHATPGPPVGPVVDPVRPTVPGPALVPPPRGPAVPPAAPAGTGPRRSSAGLWSAVGAVVVVAVVVAGAVWWWQQDHRTAVAQDGGATSTTPGGSGQPTDDPTSAGALETRLAPPGAGTPNRQVQTIGGQTTITLTYQSGDLIDRLAGHYQSVLAADSGAHFDRELSDGRWSADATSDGWSITVHLTRTDAGTTVVVNLSSTG